MSFAPVRIALESFLITDGNDADTVTSAISAHVYDLKARDMRRQGWNNLRA